MNVLTFGETMLRLRPIGGERLFQSDRLEATFGGAESNAAISLANFGADVSHLTVLPDNSLGDACIRTLRAFGVDTRKILRGAGRMGLYFLESGSNCLSGTVVYDRTDSAMARAKPGDVDWTRALTGVDWFHITGITPAISESAMELSMEAVKAAKERGITVSCDLNYRSNLWKYGKDVADVMPALVRYVDVVIASEDEVYTALGISSEGLDASGDVKYRALGDRALAAFPNIRLIAITLPQSRSADWMSWAACLNDGTHFFRSAAYEVRDIVDRVGVGDAFSGALIYALDHYPDPRQALDFAVAASCLKFSIIGDFNRVSPAEVEKLLAGGSGNVQR